MEGAFSSLLAAPLAGMPAAPGGPDPSKLIGFFAQEMQLFFAHIQSAVVTYSETGNLPHSLFTQKSVKALERAAATGEKRKEKGKRKPTAFNLFVKEKLEEFKQRGVKDPADTGTNNGLFKMAVAEWSKLSEEEKAACQAKYAPIVAGMAEGEHGTEDEEHGEGEEEEAGGHHGGGGGGHGFVDSLTADSPKKKKGKGHHHH